MGLGLAHWQKSRSGAGASLAAPADWRAAARGGASQAVPEPAHPSASLLCAAFLPPFIWLCAGSGPAAQRSPAQLRNWPPGWMSPLCAQHSAQDAEDAATPQPAVSGVRGAGQSEVQTANNPRREAEAAKERVGPFLFLP